jgi:LacI family transcriptional regulator
MTDGTATGARRDATRAAILRAALASFLERGFQGASLRDIAERAGITHAGLLHHFRGKDELLLAILAQQDADTEARAAPELDPYTGPDLVLRFLDRAVQERHRSPDLVLLRNELLAAAGRPDNPAHDYFRQRYERVRESLTANFAARVEAGTLRPGLEPAQVAALWQAVIDGLALLWRLDQDLDVHLALAQFVRLVFTSPEAEAGTRGPSAESAPSANRFDGGPEPSSPNQGDREAPPLLRSVPPPLPDTRRVTIQDVAREAGVSVSAVSKVLREAYGVSPQMRARVEAAISTLGYRPHAGARAMRGRSYTVGVTLPELASPFPSQVSERISAALEATPFQEVLVPAGVTPQRQQRSVEALVDRQVDGLILIAPWTPTSWLEQLAARVPTVVVALHGGGTAYDTVVDDDYEGARLMVRHLVDLGHRRILHTSQPMGQFERPHVLSHTARVDGYVEEMEAHGLQPDVLVTAYTEQGGYDAAVQALSRPHPPTAIFAGADIAALGVLRAAEERGVSVPEDLTVVGYDNIYTSSIRRVSLTTVDQSGELTGTTATKLLLERLDGRTEPVHHVITPDLVIRSTSAPPRDARLPRAAREA